MSEQGLMKKLAPYGEVKVSFEGGTYRVNNGWARVGNPYSSRQDAYTTLVGALAALHERTIDNVIRNAVLAASLYSNMTEEDIKKFKRKATWSQGKRVRFDALQKILTLADP